MKIAKTSGSPYMSICWLRSGVVGVSSVESSCEPTYMIISVASTQPVAPAVRSGTKRNFSAPVAPGSSPHGGSLPAAAAAASAARPQISLRRSFCSR